MYLIYGSQLSDENQLKSYKYAVRYASNELYKQYRVDAIIISDVEYLALSDAQKQQANLFIIGGPQTNSVALDVASKFDQVRFVEGEIQIGDCKLSGNSNVGVMYLAPYNEQLAFVVSGSSKAIFQYLVSLLPLHPPYDQLPDFVLLDQTHAKMSAQGILAAGYWDANWKYSSALAYTNCPADVPSASETGLPVTQTLW